MKPASNKIFSLQLPTVELPKSAVQLMSVCVMSAALAACGGSSGGTIEGEETGGSDPDPQGLLGPDEVISFGEFTPSDADPDGDGLFDFDEELLLTSPLDADSDGDGIFDGDEDTDGDGIPDLDELNDPNQDPLVSDNTDADADGNTGIITPTCADMNSSNDDWGDNCELRLGGEFANSLYVQGAQRIIWCQGFGGTQTIEQFADGIIGPITDQAIRDFQSANGLEADGIVGPRTWGGLRSTLSAVSPDQTIGGVDYARWSIDGPRCDLLTPQFYQEFVGFDLLGWQMASVPGSTILIDFSSAPAN